MPGESTCRSGAEPHSLSAHRFPTPWSVEDIGAAFVVKDSAGQELAYVYFEEESQDGARLARSNAAR